MDEAGVIFTAVAAACLIVVGVALKTGRILGVAFRSRFIARREQEPWLYWMSLAIFAAAGLLFVWAVISVELLSRP